MRILHVLDHSVPLHSGYTFRTLSLLRGQRALGWQTFHLTSPKHKGPPLLEETVDGWHFFRCPPLAPGPRLPGIGNLTLMNQLAARLEEVARQVQPQLIHAHSPVLNALPTLRVGRKLDIPVCYEVRAFWEDAAVDHGTTTEGSLRYRLTRAVETRALRQADQVFTICEGLRRDIVGRGIAPSKVVVVPNAVDIERFSLGGQADPALKMQLGLQGCAVIGFIGSFYAYEGLDLLMRALPPLLRLRADARVLLVGGGPVETALKEQARSLGVHDRVVFTGRVPHQEVQRYYDLIDVLAYPRHAMRLTELVTPLKPLEAMAQGRLVVASDVGGHRELIRHDDNGLLFRAGDPRALAAELHRVLADPVLATRLRAAGRRFVETERHWAASAAQYVPAYERLVARIAA